MTRTLGRGSLASLLLVGSTLLVATDARSDHCTLRSGRVEVRVAGSVPGCGDDATATRAFIAVEDAIAAVPTAIAPARVSVELDPPSALVRPAFAGLEARASTGTLLVARRHATPPRSVWLHEIGHLAMAGARPRALAARRLALAFEEGAADYFAATIGGDAVVGEGTETARDLARPTPIADEAWATLAFRSFDPHTFGWMLGGLLYRAEPRAGHLLVDVVASLRGASLAAATRPKEVVAALIDACPARSRPVLEQAISSWIPEELRTE